MVLCVRRRCTKARAVSEETDFETLQLIYSAQNSNDSTIFTAKTWHSLCTGKRRYILFYLFQHNTNLHNTCMYIISVIMCYMEYQTLVIYSDIFINMKRNDLVFLLVILTLNNQNRTGLDSIKSRSFNILMNVNMNQDIFSKHYIFYTV